MDAKFTKRGRGDGADGSDGGARMQREQRIAADQLGKVLHGAGAEKQNGVGFPSKNQSKVLLVDVRGREGAVGDHFGHISAETTESSGEIGIGAIAARQKNRQTAKFDGQFLGEGHTKMGSRNVVHDKTGLFRSLRGGGANGGDMRGLANLPTTLPQSGDAGLQDVNGIRAGKQEPVKEVQARESGIDGREIVRWRERNQRKTGSNGTAFGELLDELTALKRRSRDDDALAAERRCREVSHAGGSLPAECSGHQRL